MKRTTCERCDGTGQHAAGFGGGVCDCDTCCGRGYLGGDGSPDSMHGAGDGFGGEDTPHAPSASKMLGKDLPRRRKPFSPRNQEWGKTEFSGQDYIGYRWIGHAFIIEDRCGHMLIGDQLPDTEEEAQLLCRVANIARRQAIDFVNSQLVKLKFNADATSFT